MRHLPKLGLTASVLAVGLHVLSVLPMPFPSPAYGELIQLLAVIGLASAIVAVAKGPASRVAFLAAGLALLTLFSPFLEALLLQA